MASALETTSKKAGLKISIKKIDLLSNQKNINDFAINGQKIIMVGEFAYLGQILAFEDRQDKETEAGSHKHGRIFGL